MKTKNVCLTILSICFIITLFTVNNSYAKKNACGKEMTAEEMAERALAVQEIQYAMGIHQLYGAPGGDHDKEIELVWAHKTPGVSFAGNAYIVQGDIDVIYSFYGSGSRKNKDKKESGSSQQQHMMSGGAGTISYRLLTTPIIQVAGDLKTAKAWWYTPGFQTNVMNGTGNAIWSYEKYGIDFVNEDGEWKIWHFHVYNDWEIPMGEDLVEYTVEKEKGGQQMPGGQQMQGGQGAPPEGGPEMAGGQGAPPEGGQAGGAASPGRMVSDDVAPYYTAKKFGESYSLTREANPLASPRPPEPYCTFEDTFSYADE